MPLPEVLTADRDALDERLLRIGDGTALDQPHATIVGLMPMEHPLAARDAIRPQDFVGETLIGVAKHNAPALRSVF